MQDLDFAGLWENGMEASGYCRVALPCEPGLGVAERELTEEAGDLTLAPSWLVLLSTGRKKCCNFFSWDDSFLLRVILEGKINYQADDSVCGLGQKHPKLL